MHFKTMRYLTILLFTIGFSCGFTLFGQNDSDIILWGDQDLEWEDFSGPIEQNSTHEASTRGQLRAPNSWNSDSLTLIITAEFVKSKSWVKGTPSEHLLEHEQLHFDITEYHARLLRKTMTHYRFKSFETVAEEITVMFNAQFEEYRIMQDLYDQETNHSKNSEAQEKWNNKIAAFLESTSIFAQPKIGVYLGYLK